MLVCAHAAAPPQAVPSYYFDCDAPEERAAIWMRDITSLPMSVSGNFEVVELKAHPQWLSSLSIVVRNPDGATSIGMRVAWPPKGSGEPFVEALSPQLRAANQQNRAPWLGKGK